MKNANSLLKTRADNADSRIEFLEKELTRTSQYTLNRQLELHRVPETIGSDDYADETLKNTVCEALSLTGVAVTPEQIDKCHRLKKKTSVVLEFKQRVQRDPILHSKKNLKHKKTELERMNLGEMIISESMCQTNRHLDYICRRLKKRGSIEDTWFFNGRLWITSAGGKKDQIGHKGDLVRLFGLELIDEMIRAGQT